MCLQRRLLHDHSSSLSPQTPISSLVTASSSTSVPVPSFSSSSSLLSSFTVFDPFLLKSPHPASSSSSDTGNDGDVGT